MSGLDEEIRSRLLGVLDGTMDTDHFEKWLVENTWDERSALAARLDHLFAERSLLSDEELLHELRTAASTISESLTSTETGASASTVRSSLGHVSGSQTIRRHLELADTPPAAALP